MWAFETEGISSVRGRESMGYGGSSRGREKSKALGAIQEADSVRFVALPPGGEVRETELSGCLLQFLLVTCLWEWAEASEESQKGIRGLVEGL